MIALERVLRRDRAVAAVALGALALLAWVYLVRAAAGMPGMHATPPAGGLPPMTRMPAGAGLSMPYLEPWGLGDTAGLFAMWAIMMIAMMLPSVAPVVLLFLGVMRRRHAARVPALPTAAFLGGYGLAWAGFSAVAALAQWGLHLAALLSADAMRVTPAAAGALLVAAGLFQWSPLKRACLSHCRSPFHFFSTRWREGTAGALRMGLGHGLYCVGCCWLLMALLFVAGVMNLAWVAALAALVLLEKLAPGGPLVGRVVGLGLVAWGGWLVALA